MALADIQKKSAEERKREKRLVHATNALSREFLDSKALKTKTKPYKDAAEYLSKSLLDYLFFEERKELRELHENHIQHFMLVYAPNKLSFSAQAKEHISDILQDFVGFLDATGHIKNGEQLNGMIKKEKKAFQQIMPARTQSGKSKSSAAPKKTSKRRPAQKAKIEAKVGRNDPCPCGSGKKFKKCCGQKL
jgi:preprotein translocase subunit SecA